MMNDCVSFGRPEKFEIVIQWADDFEPIARRPSGHGWSMGRFQITVAGVNLTASRLEGDRQPYIGWYLAPTFDWLASNWGWLLHEEHFAWPKKGSAPAAVACRRAMNFWIGSKEESERRIYKEIQAWYHRHGLQSAAEGGVFPDLFVRRYADDIELSWSGEPAPFAPEGLTFDSGAGTARLAVEDVGEPLWNALQWLKDNPPDVHASFRENWRALRQKVERIERLGVMDFESAAIPAELLTRVHASFERINKTEFLNEHFSPGRPFIETFSPAVAMFGGVSPQLDNRDVDALRDLLISAEGGQDGRNLTELIVAPSRLPMGGLPYEDGYHLAENFLEDIKETIGDIAPNGYVGVRAICAALGVRIVETTFDTDSIRGVALAGEGFHPLIVVNQTSPFNKGEDGRRFTLAHELCHILVDRTRARRVSHTSGPWAPPEVEKRANAFAAYLLMPRDIIRKNLASSGYSEREAVKTLADRLHVSESALVEHLYNLDFIDETKREELRSVFRSRSAD